jgi:hypothetical protein
MKARLFKARMLVLATMVLASPASYATGRATCDSGPPSGWQPIAKLEKLLADAKWQVRRIKIDGGCYEVYGFNAKGERVEAYFHPLTLQPVPVKP